ncbi:titin homolog [Lucilia cuprina]|uniref:titin homolog n=1 Tax=Lucilia cuprina TaxID=7375 RepID=UPI001F06CDEB|nr:titin homolog [Lucilia cuprina]
MDAVNAVVTQPTASSATVSANTTTTATIPSSTSNAINVNQSNNNIHSHTNTHSTTTATTNNSNQNNSNISIGGGGGGVNNNSSNSNSSCSSSSTSSNSSGYGSTTTTPTNNYDLQQQTTPTTTPIPTTPVAIAEPIIPVATVAAVTPYYNESITSHNLETHQLQQHHTLHTQQQQHLQHQQQQHHLLQPQHHQLPQNHLQTNLQQQQYLSRQQYYSTYDYQQAVTPTHNLSTGPSSSSSSTPAYNLGIASPYDITASPYGSGQYKTSGLTGSLNYERGSTARTNVASYNPQQQQQQQTEQHPTKTINQQTQPFPAVLSTSKQRTSSLIGNSTSTNTSKPQAAATPFYAQPLAPQSHSNPTTFYDNTKYKMPLDYHDSYGNPSAAATASVYHQQQKYYAAAKSQLKEAGYGTPPGLANSKSVYPNTGNYFPTPAPSYDKYMYPHNAATGYTSSTGHLGNETPPEVGNYRKPVGANTINSPSWPWGIDYASGNSRTIPPPPPTNHLPTATVAPTHATYLTPNPSALARDPYYMGPEKYPMKYDKYAAASYQQSYVSPPGSRHHIWPNTPHGSNLTQPNERHMLASGPTAPASSHGLHGAPYFPANPNNGLNSRQSCCPQPYQPQNCYYPPSHAIPPRLTHNQTPMANAPSSAYLSSQTSLGQSPHLNALSASCKYGGIIPDYGNGNKIKNSNDLYLNAHHYDTNTSPHNYGYGTATAHSNQQLYASNAHQSMAHGITPSSLLTHDPLNANPASYTNDLSLTTSNFDNYHTHLDTHLSPPTLAGIHSQQPPPAYGPTVAKRALLDYRKPIQPQPPPTIAEECYTTLSSRDHYNQQELLNTPETTTTFGEYETHQNNAASLTSFTHSTEVLQEADKTNDEGNKNLSLRDFIANWNDDEDEYQNAEELNFDQNNVIDEVLQTAPVEQETAAATVDIQKSEIIKTSTDESKNKAESKVNHKPQENLDNTTLNESYVNLPDIVIDIEKSNNVNNSITTPTTSPAPNTTPKDNNTSLNLNNFDVEKELDELKLKKPTQQQDTTKDLNDIKDTNSVSTPQISPCKNLTTQLSFEDLNLEPTNKTVLNGEQSSELTENYFKDMEGYESGSSRHSNESAFEKEYETFINKITSEPIKTKSLEEQATEIDFEQNVQDFSKFYKRKRKLKEDELKAHEPEAQNQKKLKPNKANKVNINSNFPQVYTKKSRNRWPKGKPQILHKRKPLSLYYKIIHSIRRFGLYRLRRVREYMSELKEKHLPLIKRQSIKNYTHDKPENLTNPKTLKALCIIAINSEEFRQMLMLTLAVDCGECSLENEDKHICTDPSCETCEVIKSLMEAEGSFEDTLVQQVTEPITESVLILSEDVNSETLEILENVIYLKDEHKMISNDIENVQYSKENTTLLDAQVLEQCNLNPADSYFETQSDSHYESNIEKSVTEFDLKNWYEKSKSPEQDLSAKENSDMFVSEAAITESDQAIPLSPETKKETSEIPLQLESEQDNLAKVESEPDDVKQNKPEESHPDSPTELCEDENSNISNATTTKKTSTEVKKISKSITKDDSDSEESDSSESDSDSSSSSSDDESESEESKESSKKSNAKDIDSDTDSESDLENDDENLNSDTEESNHSKINDLEKHNSDCKKHQKFADSFKNVNSESENLNSDRDESNHSNMPDLEKNKSDNNECEKSNDLFKKESENVHPTPRKSPTKSISDVEDEITPKRQQRIVLRIKKSFQPSPDNNDSREIYVSEKSIEFDSQTESETEDDDIVSTTSKSSQKLKDSFDDQNSNKSLSPNKEFENHSESESEDDNISENEFNQITKRPKRETITEKSMKSQKELGNQTESESDDEDDDVTEKERQSPFTSSKQNAFVDHQSESEDDEIPEKKSKLMAKSPTHKHYNISNASEDLKVQMESVPKVHNILNRTSVIISTSLILSPQQDYHNSEEVTNHFTENQVEKEIEKRDDVISIKETKLSSKQDDLKNSSEPSNEPVRLSLENEITDLIPTSQDLLNEEKSADLLAETSKLSPQLESSKDIVANVKFTEHRAIFDEQITQNKSKFNRKEESSYIEDDIPAESKSEDDTDEEEKENFEEPIKKDADHKKVQSESESSSDSEYDSEDEENPKDSMPIVISDDESMDKTSANDNHHQPIKCISKTSEDSFQQSDSSGSLHDYDEDSLDFISEIHSNLSSNIVNSSKMSKSASKDEILPATQTLITSENIIKIAKILEEKDISNNTIQSDSDIKRSKENLTLESVENLEEKQVSNNTNQSDGKLSADIRDPKENLSMELLHSVNLKDNDESNNSNEIPKESSSNVNSSEDLLPLDSVTIKETQNIESETSSEKSLLEYSSTSDDSDEKNDDELSTKDDNETEKIPEITLDKKDQKSDEEVESQTNTEKSLSEYSSTSDDSDEEIDDKLSTNEDNETEKVPEITLDKKDKKSDEEVEDIFSIEEDKQTEEDIQISEDNKEQKSISSESISNDFKCNENVIAPLNCLNSNPSQVNDENKLLHESEASSKDPDTFEQNNKTLDILSIQTVPKETVNVLVENNPSRISENLEILADVIVNQISAEHVIQTKMVESETDPKPTENEKPHTQNYGESLTSEINDSIQQPEAKESEIIVKSIIKERTENRSYEPNLEKMHRETSNTFNTTCCDEQFTEIKDSIHQLEAKECEINSKSIIVEPSEAITYSDEMCDASNLEKVHRETSDTFDATCSNEQSTAEIETDEQNISGTKTAEFDKDESDAIVEEAKPVSKRFKENSESLADRNNERTNYLKETFSSDDLNTEIETENSETVVEAVTVQSESLEKENTAEILKETSNSLKNASEQSDVTLDPIIREPNNIPFHESIKENAEVISHPKTKESDLISPHQIFEVSNDIQSPKVITERSEITSNMETKVTEIVSKQIPNVSDTLDYSNKQLNENSGNTCELSKNKEETTHTLSKSVDEDIAESLEEKSAEKETELATTFSESITKNPDLQEESNKQTSEVLEEIYEETKKIPNTWDDTDIFKEVSQECLESIKETLDQKESNGDDITIKESVLNLVTEISEIPKDNETKSEAIIKQNENIVAVSEASKFPEENETISEAIIQPNLEEKTASLEKPKSENNEIETTTESYKSTTDICQTKSEALVLKPKRLIENENQTSEYYEESDSVHASPTNAEAFIENTNNLIKTSNEERVHQHLTTTDDVTSNEEEESMALQEDLGKSEVVEQLNNLVEDKLETFEVDDEESKVQQKECSPVEDSNENMPTNEKETEVISGFQEELKALNSQTDEKLTVERQIKTLHENIVDNNITQEVNKTPNSIDQETGSIQITQPKDGELPSKNYKQEVNKTPESFDQETGFNQAVKPKDDKFPNKDYKADEDPKVEHQTETLERIPNQTTLPKDDKLPTNKHQTEDVVQQTETLEHIPNSSLSETVLTKDNQEDISKDFLGFKNQSSFEDESEDFHGFEDLEEVARIRQEIENLNDDSTANDGFLNYGTLSRELHKTSTTSLTGSTSSEINELEALEKELSQHQPEMEGDDEEEDKQTEQDVQIATDKVVSTNDIEHIKQMLESDEEQQEQEENGKTEVDKDGVQSTRDDTNKDKSKYILSSVNSIIPKLSDLCRAALNSSLNSNSNLAQDTTETSTILVERELSVEEALAEMYRQAGVLLSDPEDCDNDISPSGDEEAHDVLLINLQEILNSDNNDVYVLQCDMNENVLNVVQQTNEERNEQEPPVSHDMEVNVNAERVNRVQFIGILDTQSTEPQIHIISSDSESEVIILSDDESDNSYRPFLARPERITIPFINDGNDDINNMDSLSDISTIHHEEIVPDNLNKFLQEEFYKYLHEKYVQRNISKYYHANRVLKKYRKRYIKSKRQ